MAWIKGWFLQPSSVSLFFQCISLGDRVRAQDPGKKASLCKSDSTARKADGTLSRTMLCALESQGAGRALSTQRPPVTHQIIIYL